MKEEEQERIHAAGFDELERMLAEAEEELKAIRAEIALRRRDQRHQQMQALPDDLSKLEGGWLHVFSVIRRIMNEG